MKKLDLQVGPADARERIDRFIAARGGISRGLARRALDAGGVFLDGKRCKVAGRTLHPGQRVEVHLEEGGRTPGASEALGRERLLFEDAAYVFKWGLRGVWGISNRVNYEAPRDEIDRMWLVTPRKK